MLNKKDSLIKKHFTTLLILVIALSYLATDLHHRKWNNKDSMKNVIVWDVISYYSYLPATFIYHDLSLDFRDNKDFPYRDKFWFVQSENGNKVILTTMGVSILYAPFFFIAHILAPLFGEARDGFGSTYQFFLVLSSLFYLCLAFFILARILKKYFSKIVANIVLLLIGLGTNLYNYGTYEAAMSHAYSFFLVILFIWLTIRWYDNPGFYSTVWLGLVYGLIVLVRPTNGLLIILLLLLGVRNFKEAGKRFQTLLSNWYWILLMILAFLIPWIPQVLYWHKQTGHLFYNAYAQVGSAFFFDSPQLGNVLFSFRKGLFIYVPLMFFAVVGITSLFRNKPELAPAILIFFLAMTYIFASWWSWWTGGSFGPRLFIDTYGVMAIPLAALIADIIKSPKLIRYLAAGVGGFLIFLNIFQTGQYYKGYIHYLGMTPETYKMQFLRSRYGPGYWDKLSIPDFVLARQGVYYYYLNGDDFESYSGLSEQEALQKTMAEIKSDHRLMRQISRMADRQDISNEEALQKVASRITEIKLEGGQAF